MRENDVLLVDALACGRVFDSIDSRNYLRFDRRNRELSF